MIIHDYEKLLTYEQKNRYKAAIRQGYFNDYHGLEWRHTFYGAYLWKYPGRVKVLSRFKQLLGRLPQWDDITDDTLHDLHDALADAYAPNSLRTILAELKALLNENKAEHAVPSMSFPETLKAKASPVQSVYLSTKEIDAIDAYQPRRRAERQVKRLFMLECLTGARKSDCERLSLENIITEGSHRFVRYVAGKSKTEVLVPADRRIRQYLVRDFNEKPMTTATFNIILQRICRDCGINDRCKVFEAGSEQSGKKYTFVTSHTGRRSFATNLALRGVTIEQISLMMGHMNGNVPNTDMTRRYIVGKMKLDDKVFRFFE